MGLFIRKVIFKKIDFDQNLTLFEFNYDLNDNDATKFDEKRPVVLFGVTHDVCISIPSI